MLPKVLAIACAATCSCGPRFLEPNPPVLVSVTRTFAPERRTEPAVLLVLQDLSLVNAADCANPTDAFTVQLQGAANQAGVTFYPLRAQVLARGCYRNTDEAIDLADYDAQVSALQSAIAPFVARPIVVYLNNVDLPLQPKLKASFDALRTRTPAPLVWGITSAQVNAQLGFDSWIEWTYLGDSELLRSLKDLASSKLPFWSVSGDAIVAPLLADDEAAQAVAVKRCTSDDRIDTSPVDADGDFTPFDPNQPPQVRATFPRQLAQPNGSPLPGSASVRVEVCRANCDRMLDDGQGPLVRWSQVRGCTLEATP